MLLFANLFIFIFYLVAFLSVLLKRHLSVFKVWKPFYFTVQYYRGVGHLLLGNRLAHAAPSPENHQTSTFESRPLVCYTDIQIQVLLFGHLFWFSQSSSTIVLLNCQHFLKLSCILSINYHTHFFVNFLTWIFVTRFSLLLGYLLDNYLKGFALNSWNSTALHVLYPNFWQSKHW